MTKDNDLLGEFDLAGIPPDAQIEIIFEIDTDGNSKVWAAEQSTGKNASITIPKRHEQTSWEEYDRKISDAQDFAEEDQRIRARIELGNFSFSLEKQARNKEAHSEILLKAINEVTDWLDNSRQASIEDLHKQEKKLIDVALDVTGKDMEDMPPSIGEWRRRDGSHDEL